MNIHQALERFCQFFEQLSVDDIDTFDQVYATHSSFKDPFHEVHHIDDIKAIFVHMFKVAPDARFIIQQGFTNEHSAMITWTMMLTVRQQAMSINGSTHLCFNEAGLVILHRDYWDTGEELFSKLPYIGPPTRWLMKQFSALSTAWLKRYIPLYSKISALSPGGSICLSEKNFFWLSYSDRFFKIWIGILDRHSG